MTVCRRCECAVKRHAAVRRWSTAFSVTGRLGLSVEVGVVVRTKGIASGKSPSYLQEARPALGISRRPRPVGPARLIVWSLSGPSGMFVTRHVAVDNKHEGAWFRSMLRMVGQLVLKS